MQNAYKQFADLYDLLMDDVDYKHWAQLLSEKIEKNAGKRKGVRVLDCACGTGNISYLLHKKGFDVVGLDCSEDMLRVAKDKQIQKNVSFPLVHQDMVKMELPYQMDAITCCCDGVNYLTSEKDAETFFKTVYRNLVPGGLFLFDVSSEYKLEHVLGTNRMGEDRKECTYLWENMYDPKRKLLEMNLHFFLPLEGDTWKRIDETHIQRAYSQKELEIMLRKAGFTDITCREAWTDKEPNEKTERLEFAGRKSK